MRAAISCGRRSTSRLDYLRLRAYPFTHEVHDFIDAHDRVYVVEQNRDAQMLQLMKLDLRRGRRSTKLRSVLHYNGLPHRRAHRHRRRARAGGFQEWQVHGRPRCNASTPAPKTEPHRARAVLDYQGGKTTLCAGCGHNAISERIIDAFYEMGVEPEQVVEAVAASAARRKSPAYFLSRSHGFNAVHGRMPSVATGAMLANQQADRHRRQRRRRHGVDRHRPVRAPDAPQPADDLHHRGQRRATA